MPKPFATHRAQIESILLAWGMPAVNAARTADVMAWADLRGVDSHGLSMLTVYDQRRQLGRLNMKAAPRIIQQTPVAALIDGDGGLGHAPSILAMETAIAKAQQMGVAVSSVRNSAHFGPAGYYSNMAAEAGMIGIGCTGASGIQVAPTFGAEAKYGTDPWTFAAPAREGEPFLLDMATTTVAAGKIRNKANEGLPLPPGWMVTAEGKPSTDPTENQKGGFLTPLGGTSESSSYKGYGLAAMVNILASALSGATMVTDPMHMKKASQDIGHFFMVINPGLFRDAADFRADVTAFCDSLRATKPADPAQPVMVAGDPERRVAATRMQQGIPVMKNLGLKVKAISEAAGVAWQLD
jgi:LDH2 family malate/lactate/ureidoglycolate dehydrogenase